MQIELLNQNHQWIKWRPSLDSFVGIITVLCMWLSFYLMYHTDSLMIRVLVFGLFGNIIICIGVPVVYTLLFRNESLSIMGITKRNIIPGIVISIGLAFGDLQELIPLLHGNNWQPQLLFNILLFWEPFFIFGWLYPRFKKDYGTIPAIILSGISLCIYHIGSFPAEKLIEYAISGIIFSAVYSVIGNILVMWPIYWCIGATVGTINGKMEFDWIYVAFNLVIIIVQGLIIISCLMIQKKKNLTQFSNLTPETGM